MYQQYRSLRHLRHWFWGLMRRPKQPACRCSRNVFFGFHMEGSVFGDMTTKNLWLISFWICHSPNEKFENSKYQNLASQSRDTTRNRDLFRIIWIGHTVVMTLVHETTSESWSWPTQPNQKVPILLVTGSMPHWDRYLILENNNWEILFKSLQGRMVPIYLSEDTNSKIYSHDLCVHRSL